MKRKEKEARNGPLKSFFTLRHRVFTNWLDFLPSLNWPTPKSMVTVSLHETLLHIGPQVTLWSIWYYHQYLHQGGSSQVHTPKLFAHPCNLPTRWSVRNARVCSASMVGYEGATLASSIFRKISKTFKKCLTRNICKLVPLKWQVDQLGHFHKRFRIDRFDAIIVQQESLQSGKSKRVVRNVHDVVEAEVEGSKLGIGLAVECSPFEGRYFVVLKNSGIRTRGT